MQKLYFLLPVILLSIACNNKNKNNANAEDTNTAFNNFQPQFMDAYGSKILLLQFLLVMQSIMMR